MDNMYYTQAPDHLALDVVKQTEGWYIPTFNYYRGACLSSTSNVRSDMRESDALYNGFITQEQIDDILSEVNNKRIKVQLRKKFRKSNLLITCFEKLLGDYDKIPYNVLLKANNTVNLDKLYIALNAQVYDYVVRQVEELRSSTDAELPAESIKLDIAALRAKAIDQLKGEEEAILSTYLDTVKDDVDFANLKRSLFIDWLKYKQWYCRITNNGERLIAQRLDPLQSYPLLNSDEDISTMPAFLYIDTYNYDDAYNKFMESGYPDVIDFLNRHKQNASVGLQIHAFTSIDTGVIGDDHLHQKPQHNAKAITVEYLQYKTKRVKQYVRSVNQFGVANYVEYVPTDTYHNSDVISVPSDIVVEQYRIECMGSFHYTKPVELIEAPVDSNGLFRSRLTISGKFDTIHDRYQTLTSRVIKHVIMYELYDILINNAFARFKGTVRIMPSTLYSDDTDLTKLQKLQLQDVNNELFYDPNKVDPQLIQYGIKVIGDNDVVNYITTLINKRDEAKREVNDALHLLGPRGGDQSQYQSNAAARTQYEQQLVGSTKLFKDFDESLVNLLDLCLEISKYVYFGRSSMESVFTDGYYTKVLASKAYGLVLTDSIEEMQRLQSIKEYSFSMAQNGNAELAFIGITSNNSKEIRDRITDTLRKQQEQLQLQEQQRIEWERQKLELELQDNERERQVKLQIAQMQAQAITTSASVRAQAEVDTNADTNIMRERIERNRATSSNINSNEQVGLSYADDKPAVDRRLNMELLKLLSDTRRNNK
jgi:hypothetical protein